jgi:hypothetical protein
LQLLRYGSVCWFLDLDVKLLPSSVDRVIHMTAIREREVNFHVAAKKDFGPRFLECKLGTISNESAAAMLYKIFSQSKIGTDQAREQMNDLI